MSSPTDDSLTNNVALPKSLDGQLRGFRRRLRVLKLVEVVLANRRADVCLPCCLYR